MADSNRKYSHDNESIQMKQNIIINITAMMFMLYILISFESFIRQYFHFFSNILIGYNL